MNTIALLANSDNPFKEPYGPADLICIGFCVVVAGAVAFRLAYLIVRGVFF